MAPVFSFDAVVQMVQPLFWLVGLGIGFRFLARFVR